MTPISYQINGNDDGTKNITVYEKGNPTPHVAHSTHPYFERIVEGVLAGDESVVDLFDLSLKAGMELETVTERITSAHGLLYFDGEPMDDELSQTVLRFIAEGVDDWKPIALFFENVMQNPNEHSREHLYRWLQAEAFTLTPEGMIVGYKSVNSDGNGGYISTYDGKAIVDGKVVEGPIPNKIGSTVSMPRGEVTFDPAKGCSIGLHVGTYRYATEEYRKDALLEVEVNPRDVVSVPTESKDQKMRVCRYKIVGLTQNKIQSVVKPTATKETQVAEKPVKVKVKKGQVYEDTDKRRPGRLLRILKVNRLAMMALAKNDDTGKEKWVQTRRLQSSKYRLLP